ncbi:MAG: protein kinase, partial [Thermoanaerobaculia bacterium]|nr:protein kinase [Thermoanaerobaculia bacterium]
MPQDAEPGTGAPDPLPERLGVYRIESQLGRGGMGEVYLAWDELLERHVAIKRIHADKLQDPIHRARFLREARAVARLDHPAIVRVYHVLERDDGDCLVMEYVRGRDLARVLAEERMALARALAIAREIALGLADGARRWAGAVA